MSPTQINAAIAESLGWINQGRAKGVPALNHRWVAPNSHPKKVVDEFDLPNYYADLNACHEMEEHAIKHGLAKQLGDELVSVTTVDRGIFYAHATAPQRCDAYLKVKGLTP